MSVAPEPKPAAGPTPFIVRVPGLDGDSVGLGVLVGPKRVVTCAHVVNVALGRDPREPAVPEKPVWVEFAASPTQRNRAHIELWQPPAAPSGDGGGDIAGLLLDGDVELPAGTDPARLLLEIPQLGQELLVFGYPRGRPAGTYARAQVVGLLGAHRLQLDSVGSAAWWVQPGFSGSPAYDTKTGCVVGIVALAASPQGTRAGDSYAITAGALNDAWPAADMHTVDSRKAGHEADSSRGFEFYVDNLKDLHTIASHDPLVIQGHYRGVPPPVRVVLQDSYGNYYVQNPPVNFTPDGHWYATNVCVGAGIMFVVFLELDQASASHFNDMVWQRRFGGFSPLPEGSRVLKQIRVCRQ